MTDLSIAQRIFNRQFHSEGDRQRLIQQKTAQIERDIKTAILKDKAELHEIAELTFTEMEPETMGFVLLAFLTSDLGALRSAQLMVQGEYQQAVAKTAELRAIRQVEAMTPEDFDNE